MKWRLYKCSDCDYTDRNQVIVQVPDDAPYEYGCPIDYCPACESIGSMGTQYDVEIRHTRLKREGIIWEEPKSVREGKSV